MEALSVPAACARASAGHDAKTSAKSICTITPAFLLDAPLQRILPARPCMGQRSQVEPPAKSSSLRARHCAPYESPGGSYRMKPRALSLSVRVDRWPIAGAFAISRGAKTEAVVVVAELSDGAHRGR